MLNDIPTVDDAVTVNSIEFAVDFVDAAVIDVECFDCQWIVEAEMTKRKPFN